jgi:ribosome recycling factor
VDEQKRLSGEMQHLTDDHIKKIDDHLVIKQKEITHV